MAPENNVFEIPKLLNWDWNLGASKVRVKTVLE